jgi:hypothetical protein
LSLSSATTIQRIPLHIISPRSILILTATYILVFLVILFPLTFESICHIHSSYPLSCYMLCPSHPPLFANCKYTCQRVQVIKLLIMQPCSISCHFTPLRSTYSTQHPVLKHLQPVFLL